MTVLGAAAAVYAGGVAASAVYAGTVKVWPAAPPPPTASAAWGEYFGDESVPVALIFSGITPATAGVVTVAIPPYNSDPAIDGGDIFAPLNRESEESPDPPRLLIAGGGEVVLVDIMVTLGDAYWDWAGHAVSFTLDGAGHVTAVAVAGTLEGGP